MNTTMSTIEYVMSEENRKNVETYCQKKLTELALANPENKIIQKMKRDSDARDAFRLKVAETPNQPSRENLEELFSSLNFPKWLKFEWLYRSYDEQLVWATCFHEIGHFAVVPNYYINYQFYDCKHDKEAVEIYIKQGGIPHRIDGDDGKNLDFRAIALELKNSHLRCQELDKEYFEKHGLQCDHSWHNQRYEQSDLIPNEFGVRAWCFMVLEQKGWINPIELNGFTCQWSDSEGVKPSPWKTNEHLLGSGINQLQYWGMMPKRRPIGS